MGDHPYVQLSGEPPDSAGVAFMALVYRYSVDDLRRLQEK
jgi:hypothetical protein